jgi:hypothetical protein
MRKILAKVGKREILYWHGDTMQTLIKMNIPGIAIVNERDWRAENGNLRIYFEDGDWKIDYEFLPERIFRYRLAYYLTGEPIKGINIELQLSSFEKDEKTGKYYTKEVNVWRVIDYGNYGSKVFTHNENETEIAEELLEPKITKSITNPNITLEYYKNNKILKLPYFNDEIRINIENENLEYIRNNKKIIKVYPLNKEIHFYGIKPETYKVDRTY